MVEIYNIVAPTSDAFHFLFLYHAHHEPAQAQLSASLCLHLLRTPSLLRWDPVPRWGRSEGHLGRHRDGEKAGRPGLGSCGGLWGRGT